MSCPEVWDDRNMLTFSRGVDFDDAEYGFNEEDKDPRKVTWSLFPLLIKYMAVLIHSTGRK